MIQSCNGLARVRHGSLDAQPLYTVFILLETTYDASHCVSECVYRHRMWHGPRVTSTELRHGYSCKLNLDDYTVYARLIQPSPSIHINKHTPE